MTARPSEQGFTLVELLVALTLIGLLTAILFGGMRFGARASDAVGTLVDRSAQIALAYDFMQSELTDARMLTDSSDPTKSSPNFIGQPDSVDFITAPPAYLALGGFHWLHVAMDESGRRVIVSWQQIPRGMASSDPETLRPSILLDKARSVSLAYFGTADPNQPPTWLDHWTGRSDLPRLVRLRIVLADGWQAPDLIVAPRFVNPAQP